MLSRYDHQLRTEAEVADAPELTRIGPLWLATFPERRRGFVTYERLTTPTSHYVAAAVDHFATDPRVDEFEWKTRGHDDAPELLQELRDAGFSLGDEETVMVGAIESVMGASDGLPLGFTLEKAENPEHIREAEALAGRVFGSPPSESSSIADDLVRRYQEKPNSFEMWMIRDAAGEVVCSGRVDFVEGTEFASIWGGACLEDHRGQGLYRELTAARAESALAKGKYYMHSDCTEFSRPILQRAGMEAVTTSIPATWRR